MIPAPSERQILTIMQASFSSLELEEKTRLLFQAWLSQKEFESQFNCLFSISYKLIFGYTTYEQALLLLLQNYYRNEFFVKEVLYSELLKGGCHLSEYPVGECRADVLSLDESYPACFEIKTKYDSLFRLEKQIGTYTSVFPYTSVVCSDDKRNEVLEMIPDYCGLYYYKDRSNCRIVRQRGAKVSPVLNSMAILSCFRTAERRKEFGTDDCNVISSEYSSLELSSRLAVYLKSRIRK